MSGPFRVALSGDFRKADGSPVYPDFDLEPLGKAPNVEFAYLEPRNPVEADQLKDFDALILLAHRFGRRQHQVEFRLAAGEAQNGAAAQRGDGTWMMNGPQDRGG
jgi:hypothetical protein